MGLAETLRNRRIPLIISDLLRRRNTRPAAVAVDQPSLADQLGDDHVASTEEAPPLSRNIADMDVNSFLDGIETAVLLDGQGRIRVNPAIRSAILSVGLDARYFSRLHDIIIGREVIATHKYSSRYGERCKYFDADDFKALAVLCRTIMRKIPNADQIPNSRTMLPWGELVAEAKRELGDSSLAEKLHQPKSREEIKKKGRTRQEAARRDSSRAEGFAPVVSKEDRALVEKTPNLNEEMEGVVKGFDKEVLRGLSERIPRSVSTVDFVRLGVPEYVAEVIIFIYAVDQKEAFNFDLSWVSEISYTTFRNAVYICHKYLEVYEHNQKTPVKDLLRLYKLMRIAAKDQIREQRMAVEISRELKE